MKRPETMQDTGSGSVEDYEGAEQKTTWQDSAACKDKDIEMLFGNTKELGSDAVEEQQRLACVAICGGCEVDFECLEAAKKEEKLGADPQEAGVYGVRGGLTEAERRKLYRRLRRIKSRRKRRTRAV